MDKTYIYGNWKMNNGQEETKTFFKSFQELLKADREIKENLEAGDLEIALFPPFTSLHAAVDSVEPEFRKNLLVGGQNVYFEESGAFTGEISVKMLKETGCSHVIIGHSERRHIFNESDQLIAKKLKKCLNDRIIAVLCFGETLEERESGKTEKVIERQLASAVKEINGSDVNSKKVIFAYEPVWAIGTGKSATPEDAQSICSSTREILKRIDSTVMPDEVVVLYGGSVKDSNAEDLLLQPDIDGALIGGASLKPESLVAVIREYLKSLPFREALL